MGRIQSEYLDIWFCVALAYSCVVLVVYIAFYLTLVFFVVILFSVSTFFPLIGV